MKTVHKYPIPWPPEHGDVVTLDLPQGAELLTVQLQRKDPMLWALVDPEQPPARRRFRIAGTGHPIGEALDRYVGTFQVVDLGLVFHVFALSGD